MRVLSLDTTSTPGSAAFLHPGRRPLLSAPDDQRPFGERLPGWLLEVLRDAGTSVGDVNLFVVGAGPGSLTGLRVGIATMQGLALATGRPLAAVSSLEALAHAAAAQDPGRAGEVVVSWSNARRNEVFAQVFLRAGETRLEPLSAPAVGAPAALAASWAPLVEGRRLLVIGDAAAGCEPAWAACGIERVGVLPAVPLAATMAHLGAALASRGGAGLPHAVRPLYVRRPDAEVARDRAAAAGEPHARR